MTSENQIHRPAPVVLGEVLFDHFPDGGEVLGGAPFNVAWHLQGFGMNPRFVSRIGDDEQGRRIQDAMAAWGLSARSLQSDPEQRTGRVEVRASGEDVSFDIPTDQAFDRIESPAADVLPPEPWILYHGTLALRTHSEDRFGDLRRRSSGVFLDVNLRDPWWEIDRTSDLIAAARWVKMNEEELVRLGGEVDPVEFCRKHDLEGLIVTRGSRGAEWFGAEGSLAALTPPPVSDLVDPVGAGDAFSAVCLVGLISDWKVPDILSRAVEFAADLCRQQGATSVDPKLYDRSWSHHIAGRTETVAADRNVAMEDE